MPAIDFKTAIESDIRELEMAIDILSALRDVNQTRLRLLEEAERRS